MGTSDLPWQLGQEAYLKKSACRRFFLNEFRNKLALHTIIGWLYRFGTMLLQLTIYLIDGTHDYVEIYQEIGDLSDLLMELRRFGSLMTDTTWYPLHSIVKIRCGWIAEMMADVSRQKRSARR
jgi:hypothetical protein